MTSRNELLALWSEVTERLEAAEALVPHDVAAGTGSVCVERCRDFLEHNELELALDELEALGDANELPDTFWRELTAAARLMNLEEHFRRLSSRIATGDGV